MNALLKIFFGIVILGLAGVIIYFAVAKNSVQPPNNNGDSGVAFSETGNLVRNNPGLEPDVWYLVYETEGQPAANAELLFVSSSRCVVDGDRARCRPDDFAQGARAEVEGTENDGVVTVDTLTLLETNGGNGDHDDLIRVTTPQPYAAVHSPLTIEGEARGTWYFEASFPVRLLDGNGNEIAVTPAQAQGDWMTEEFVPFQATLSFPTPTTATGTLVLEKDNPSGLPENADQIRIPVAFSQNERTVKLYYYNEDQDKDENGNVMCSREGLVAVERNIPVTNTPIQDTIRLLIEGNLTAQEENQGITTEYPLQGFALEGANLQDGHLTLEFNDPQNTTTGGSCRVTVLWAQIEATANAFPEVTSVSFIPEDLFQP